MKKMRLPAILLAAFLSASLSAASPALAAEAPATTAEPAKPVGAPSDAAVMVWAKEAAGTVLKKVSGSETTSFQSLQSYFTDGGWAEISKAVKKAGIPDTHITKSARVKPFKIVDQGLTGDVYSWTLEGEGTYTYSTYDEKDSETDRLALHIVIEFAPTKDDPHHIAIATWQATLLNNGNKKQEAQPL